MLLCDQHMHGNYCFNLPSVFFSTPCEITRIRLSRAHSPRRESAYAGVLHEDVYAVPQAVHSTFQLSLHDQDEAHNAPEEEVSNTALNGGT